MTPKTDNVEGEGDQHAAAVLRIMQLLHAKGARVMKDQQQRTVNSDRVQAYFPDVYAEWSPVVVEINGRVGHTSKRSYENEQNQKKFFEEKGVKFFSYSPQEIAGKGWLDSKGKRHCPHTDQDLYADWGL